MQPVHRYEALANQVMGDPITALFGLRSRMKTRLRATCEAAPAMQSAIRN
jgi:class 3 adenylate cyclase